MILLEVDSSYVPSAGNCRQHVKNSTLIEASFKAVNLFHGFFAEN